MIQTRLLQMYRNVVKGQVQGQSDPKMARDTDIPRYIHTQMHLHIKNGIPT